MKLLENTSWNYSSDELEQIKLFYEAHKKDLNNLEQKILPKLSNTYERELIENLISGDETLTECRDRGLTPMEITIYVIIFILMSMAHWLVLGENSKLLPYLPETFP